MKVLLVNHSDLNGGAARAANRLLMALRQHKAIDEARMLVSIKQSGDMWIDGPASPGAIKLAKAKSRLSRWGNLFYRSDNPGTHSPLCIPTNLSDRINATDADIVHLHWINNGTLSIADIARINKPLVWTFHDMWPFCGAEHYTPSQRWSEGYLPGTRTDNEWGPDLNRLTWLMKKRYWTRPIQVVAPSTWIADCVKQSPLMSHWPVDVVPNSIDLQRWRPMPQVDARQALGIPRDARVVMFGALDNNDPRKGFDLLEASLARLARVAHDTVVLTVGDQSSSLTDSGNLRHIALGRVQNDEIMRQAYCAADVFAITSRPDNLPNTALEAQACGLPVVAFDVGGMRDIVLHQQTGFLCHPFNIDNLLEGLHWTFSGSIQIKQERRDITRKSAERRWSPIKIADQHIELYRSLTAGNKITALR